MAQYRKGAVIIFISNQRQNGRLKFTLFIVASTTFSTHWKSDSIFTKFFNKGPQIQSDDYTVVIEMSQLHHSS